MQELEVRRRDPRKRIFQTFERLVITPLFGRMALVIYFFGLKNDADALPSSVRHLEVVLARQSSRQSNTPQGRPVDLRRASVAERQPLPRDPNYGHNSQLSHFRKQQLEWRHRKQPFSRTSRQTIPSLSTQERSLFIKFGLKNDAVILLAIS